jgi:prolyl-tRNA synthetase
VKASLFHLPTLREAPAEADLASHRLLLRAGFIRPLATGVFTFLPLGWRVVRRLMDIVREEMDRAGALEVLMPSLHPLELWQQTGRTEAFGEVLFRLQDRNGRWWVLGPTHEEVVTELVARDVTSYKQLPLNLYQITVKFRDEPRPRGGLLRMREFIMKDAYSFDVDEAGLERSYQAMQEAYSRTFARLGLETIVVEAAAGAMGGSDTREFMLLCEAGEDTVLLCDRCNYRANAECARTRPVPVPHDRDRVTGYELVETPGMTTIEQVSEFLGVAPEQLVKTLLYRAGEDFVAALVRGDRELNETKLAQVVGREVRMATAEEIVCLTGAPVGFSGPVGLPPEVFIVADYEIAALTDFVVGANRVDAHLVGVDWGVDFRVDQWADLRQAVHGDPCPVCSEGYLSARRAIELGHLFKLGTKYSQALGAYVDTEDGRRVPMLMGCYGLGISRCVAALVEAHHDADGIIWPLAVAPFQVVILQLEEDPRVVGVAERLEETLQAAGWEVLRDDRPERPGVKFKDADLIGFPLQVVAGRRFLTEGLLEVRRRRDRQQATVPPEQVPTALASLAAEA